MISTCASPILRISNSTIWNFSSRIPKTLRKGPSKPWRKCMDSCKFIILNIWLFARIVKIALPTPCLLSQTLWNLLASTNGYRTKILPWRTQYWWKNRHCRLDTIKLVEFYIWMSKASRFTIGSQPTSPTLLSSIRRKWSTGSMIISSRATKTLTLARQERRSSRWGGLWKL